MGKYFKGGRLWSAEAFRLRASVTLSNSDQTMLAKKAELKGPAPVTVVSDSAQDSYAIAATPRTITAPIDLPPPGSPVGLSIDETPYAYTVQGDDAAAAATGYAGVVNAGGGNPTFLASESAGESLLTARTPGTAANASVITAPAGLGTPVDVPGVDATARVITTPIVLPTVGDPVSRTIDGTPYSYTVQEGDDAAAAATGLAGVINADAGNPTFLASGVGTDAVLTARTAGTAANASVISADTGLGTPVDVPGAAATARTITTPIVLPPAGSPVGATIDGTPYAYTVQGDDAAAAATGLAGVINADAGNPTFLASGVGTDAVLTARTAGTAANASVISADTGLGEGSDIPGAAAGPGSGMHSIKVKYLDADFNEHIETLILLGTAEVATEGDAVWVQKIWWASGAQPAGHIVAKIAGDTVCELQSGGNSMVSEGTAFLVPAGKQLRLIKVLGTASVATLVTVMAQHDPDTDTTLPGGVTLVEFFCWQLPQDVDIPYHVGPFPTGTMVVVAVKGAADTVVAVSLDAFLEPDGAANA